VLKANQQSQQNEPSFFFPFLFFVLLVFSKKKRTNHLESNNEVFKEKGLDCEKIEKKKKQNQN